MSWLDIFSDSAKKKKRLDRVFAGREPLDDRSRWESYFQQYGVAQNTVTKVQRILSEILGADLARIRDTDDFSKDLAFFWELDSLADVEIVEALEREFDINITDAEAAEMKTLRDIVLGVHGKIKPVG